MAEGTTGDGGPPTATVTSIVSPVGEGETVIEFTPSNLTKYLLVAGCALLAGILLGVALAELFGDDEKPLKAKVDDVVEAADAVAAIYADVVPGDTATPPSATSVDAAVLDDAPADELGLG